MEKHINNLLGVLQQAPADPCPQWQQGLLLRIRNLIEDMAYGSPSSNWKSQLESFITELNGFKAQSRPIPNEGYIDKVTHGIRLILTEP